MSSSEPIIKSMLDDDLYKFTMCQAVSQLYPHAQARYEFINRGQHRFPASFGIHLTNQINNLTDLALTNDEANWLHKTCPFLTPVFIDFLKGYQYDPSEVCVYQNGQELEVEVVGPWYRTILWEVKLMAIISELYQPMCESRNLSLAAAEEKAARKARRLGKAGCQFADFGTRRRFSADHHDAIIKELVKHGEGHLVGTSNMALAMHNNIKPIGTQAHEWFMFHGAKYGYKEANRVALRQWVRVYHGNLGIALSDTFTTQDFFRAFESKYAKLFDGVRHDSGDPKEFTDNIINHYQHLGIDPITKTIVFSDGLNPNLAIELNNYCADRIRCSFGIGTNFTNDIDDSQPMNIVIKMTECKPYGESDWLPVVKLSDTAGKHTGTKEEVKLCKESLRL